MIRERGGSSSFARHAFNELIAFVAGWAILIDYLIVAALAAISVPHYLEPLAPDLSDSGGRSPSPASSSSPPALSTSSTSPVAVASARSACSPSPTSPCRLAVIVVGVLAVLHPDRLTDQIHLFSDPSVTDIVYASVIAMLAYAGIEAASDLAPDIDVHPRDLKRIVSVGRGRGAAGLRRDGGDRADGGAGRRRARGAARRRSATSSSRRRCWGWSPPTTPPGSRTRCAGSSRWSPPRSSSGRRRPRCWASRATSTRWRSTARFPAGWAS